MKSYTLFGGHINEVSSIFPNIKENMEHLYLTILRPDGTVVVDHLEVLEYDGYYDRIDIKNGVCEEEYKKWEESDEVIIVVNSCENHRCAVYCKDRPLLVKELDGCWELEFFLDPKIPTPGSGGAASEALRRIEEGINNIEGELNHVEEGINNTYGEASAARSLSYSAYYYASSGYTKLSALETKLNNVSNQVSGVSSQASGISSQVSSMANTLDQTNTWGNASSQSLKDLVAIATSPATWLNATGASVAALQAQLKKAGYTLPAHEISHQVYGAGCAAAVADIQKKYQLPETGRVDEATMKAIADASERNGVRRVSGTVLMDDGRPGTGITVGLFQGTSSQPLATFPIKEDGRFDLATTNTTLDLTQAVVKAATNSAASPWVDLTKRFSIGDSFTKLDLVAPTKDTYINPGVATDVNSAEYDRLKTALSSALGSATWESAIRSMAESDSSKDISALHQKTGWDARILALRIAAARLRSSTPLSEQCLYALFRMGLPTNLSELEKVSRSTAQDALSSAISKKIIADDVDVDDATAPFSDGKEPSRVNDNRFDVVLPGSNYTANDLIDKLRLLGIVGADLLVDALMTMRCSYAELVQKAIKQGTKSEYAAMLTPFGFWMDITQNGVELSYYMATRLRDQYSWIDYSQEKKVLAEIVRFFGQTDDWVTVFDEYSLDPWGFVPGKKSEVELWTRTALYAQEISRKVRSTSPTTALIVDYQEGRIERSIGLDLEPAIELLRALRIDANIAFELDTHSIRQVYSQAVEDKQVPGTWGEEVLDLVETMQRVYQMSPSVASFNALIRSNIRSAQDVAAIPRQHFIDTHAGQMGTREPLNEEAALVFEKAVQIAQVAHNTASAIRFENALPTIAALPRSKSTSNSSPSGQFPTLKSLFGTFDQVEIDDVRSTLSPAAYFVDLLHFIDPSDSAWHAKSQSDKIPKPFDVLTRGEKFGGEKDKVRRPDIPHLKLTRENTLTTLPYIDLVNEVLEYVVAKTQIDPNSFHGHDTKAETRDELVAEPLHVSDSAYVPLKTRKYPMSFPFDLPLETTRQTLAKLATPLHEAMEAFRKSDDARRGILLERLGISPEEYELLGKTYTDGATDGWHELYGDLSATERSKLSELATRLEISQRDLVALLDTRYVNPALNRLGLLHKLGITPMAFDKVIRGRSESSLLSDLASRKDDVSKAVLARLHEAREKCATPNTAFTDEILKPLCDTLLAEAVDKTLVVVETDAPAGQDPREVCYANSENKKRIDWEPLVRLNLFVRLWKKLSWSIEEVDRMLTCFAPSSAGLKEGLLSLGRYLELAERLGWNTPAQRQRSLTILSEMSTTGIRPTYDALFLTSTGKKARRISLPEEPLFETWKDTVLASPEKLSHHHAVVEATLGVSEEDLRTILNVTSREYAHEDLTLETVSLLDAHVVLAKGLGMSVTELATVMKLTGTDSCYRGGASAQPLNKRIEETAAFAEIALALKQSGLSIEEAGKIFTSRADESWELRYQPLQSELYEAIAKPLTTGITIVYDESQTSQVADLERGAHPSTDAGHTQVELHGFFEIPRSGDYQLTIGTDSGESTSISLELKVDGKQVVKETAFKTGGAIALPGLTAKTPYEFSLKAKMSELPELPKLPKLKLAMAGGVEEDAAPILWRPQRQIRRSLAKASRLIEVLDLSAAEVGFFAPSRFEDLFEFTRRSEVDGGASPLPISLVRYANLKRHAMVKDAKSVIGVLTGDQRIDSLAAATGRSNGEVQGVAELLELAAPQTFDVKPIDNLARLLRALEVTKGLSLSSAKAIQTKGAEIDDVTSRGLRDSLKSRYLSEKEWQKAIKPVSDQLRKTRRDRLVSYLLDLYNMERPEQLFEYLLIDPMTEPVVETSRLLFMTASVQLFIQRCLMNMEAEVDPKWIDRDEWEWVKRYRLWEANRKVFLYPENWLEPEFRADKSHLFAQFESALLEGNITNDLAESAFCTYLQQLEEIARLRIVAAYVEEEVAGSGREVLHVIGRTDVHPCKYFYRSRANGAWSAWEPVRFDSEGSLLALLRWRGRMVLFGANIVAFPDPNESVGSSAPDDESTATLDSASKQQITGVQINWVERIDGKWGADSSSATLPLWRPPTSTAKPTSNRRSWREGRNDTGDASDVKVPGEHNDLFMHATVDAEGDVATLHFATQLENASRKAAVVFEGRHLAPRVDQLAYRSFTDNPIKTLSHRGSLLTGGASLDAQEPGLSLKQGYWTVLSQTGNRWTVCIPAHVAGWAANRKLPYFYQDERHCYLAEEAPERRWIQPTSLLAKDHSFYLPNSRAIELKPFAPAQVAACWPTLDWQKNRSVSPQALHTKIAQDQITQPNSVINLGPVDPARPRNVTVVMASGGVCAQATETGELVLKDGLGNQAIANFENDQFVIKEIGGIQQTLIGEAPSSKQLALNQTLVVSGGLTQGAGNGLTR